MDPILARLHLSSLRRTSTKARVPQPEASRSTSPPGSSRRWCSSRLVTTSSPESHDANRVASHLIPGKITDLCWGIRLRNPVAIGRQHRVGRGHGEEPISSGQEPIVRSAHRAGHGPQTREGSQRSLSSSPRQASLPSAAQARWSLPPSGAAAERSSQGLDARSRSFRMDQTGSVPR